MAELNKANPLHWILGVSLVLIGLFVLITLVLVKSQADVDTDVTIENVQPVVETLYLSETSSGDEFGGGDIIEASANSTRTIYARGTAYDLNGDEDLVAPGDLMSGSRALVVRLYITSSECTSLADDDYRDCRWVKTYSGAPEGDAGTCTVTAGTANTHVDFTCPIEIRYDTAATDAAADTYAENDWTVSAKYTDSNGSESNSLTDTGYNITTFNAIGVTASIDFGTMAIGSTSGSDVGENITITQWANNKQDVNISGSAMVCTIGTIPVGSLEWSLTQVNAGNGTDLTGSGVLADINLLENITDTARTKTIFMDLLVPNNGGGGTTGVGGTCSGTITIASISSAD